jgi:hypothetical protein
MASPAAEGFTLRPTAEPSVPQNQVFAEILEHPDSDQELVVWGAPPAACN